MLFYNLSTDEVLKKLGSRRKGLTANEVKKRQKKFGENIEDLKYKDIEKDLNRIFKNSKII